MGQNVFNLDKTINQKTVPVFIGASFLEKIVLAMGPTGSRNVVSMKWKHYTLRMQFFREFRNNVLLHFKLIVLGSSLAYFTTNVKVEPVFFYKLLMKAFHLTHTGTFAEKCSLPLCLYIKQNARCMWDFTAYVHQISSKRVRPFRSAVTRYSE